MEHPIPSTQIEGSFISKGFQINSSERKAHFKKYWDPSSDTFNFQGIHFTGELKIVGEGASISSYNFERCYFDGPVLINLKKCDSFISFGNCQVDGDVVLEGGEYSNSIAFENVKSNAISVLSGKFKELFFSSMDTIIGIRGGHFDSLMIGDNRPENNHLYELTLELFGVTGNIRVYHTIMYYLHVYGQIPPELFVSVMNCRVKKMVISNLTNKGALELDNIYWDPGNPIEENIIDVGSEGNVPGALNTQQLKLALKYHKSKVIEIASSNLGSAQLNNIDFSTYDVINIYKSRISDIVVSNINWPSKVFAYYPENSRHFSERFYKAGKLDRYDYSAMRENYRQLKYACSKQLDFIGEQHFHGLEMFAYDRSLLWQRKSWTKAVLKLSYLTSNFGQSIVRPLLSIVIINGTLFYLLFLTKQGPFKGYNFAMPQNYVNTLAEFIRFVNPLHKNDPELTGWAFIIDVLIRICSSYFIYNLIRATRRFVR